MRGSEVHLVSGGQNDFRPGGRFTILHGFDTIVVEKACRALDLNGTAARTKAAFRASLPSLIELFRFDQSG